MVSDRCSLNSHCLNLKFYISSQESEIEAYGDIEEPRQIAVDRDDRTASRANIHDSHGHLPSGYPPEASTSPPRSCILSGTSVKSKRPKSASKNPVNLGHATIGPSRSNPSPIAGSSKLVYRTPKNIPARESDEFGRYESSCCHQCQVNTTQPKMICDQSQDPNCVVRVCITCLTKSKVYDDHVELRPPIFKFTPGGRMLCVKCRDVCPCASCRRGRSEKDHSSRGSDSSAHDFCVLALEEREEFSSKKQARHEPKRQKQESRPSIEKTLCSHSQFDVSLDAFTQWKNSFDRDDKAQLATISVDKQIFSNTLTAQATPATNQKPNGRCWLFATCNLARMGIVKKFDLGDFELSQSRLVFYDFLEKADFYLKSMIELVELPIEARIISHISGSPLGDGGQWDMAAGLIEKYGLVPQPIYDDSFNYLNSSGINAFLTSKLRDQALELRQIYKDAKAHAADNLGQDSESATIAGIRAARQAKETMMAQVYRCLAIALGSPPSPTESFKWDYVDKSGKAHSLVSTPLDFYHKHCAGFQASEYISLINDPRNPYNKSYTIERVGNIWGGRPIRHVNTSPDVLKSSVIKMIQADKPVWLGCDASKMSDLSHGIMDTKLIDYKATFGVTSRLSKSDRLRMGDGVISHVMVITAVHLDEEGKPVRYKAENSWSDTAGPHGCFVMTDAWFDEYVYQIVLPKSFTSDLLREIYDDPEPSVLPPWGM
ncbi:bleomycin hydrolase-like protein [Melampsora larici-populina 98AG31]|uniref:Cysteine proteinase 1, mitochondrial n=1 Tax=Melampsora larici-populina (strain 98AG31 / pathotype 3-4-7) TaxID=747676 RepID=F4RRM1_MELLP|nr:bleomycin hydrolase-like protein [Melampsora larici-populina 98AG31]EGG04951.1 bleomycin hydrolase-like protein [Melampsora larici-populina 98AG31]